MNYSCTYLNFNYQPNIVKNHTVPKNISTITLKLRMHYSFTWLLPCWGRAATFSCETTKKFCMLLPATKPHIPVSTVLVKNRPLAFFFSLVIFILQVHFISFVFLNHSAYNTNNKVSGISLRNWLSNLKGQKPKLQTWKIERLLKSHWNYRFWLSLLLMN